MEGSKIVVRKPLRRYERDYGIEQESEEEQAPKPESRPDVFTDITAAQTLQASPVSMRGLVPKRPRTHEGKNSKQ